MYTLKAIFVLYKLYAGKRNWAIVAALSSSVGQNRHKLAKTVTILRSGYVSCVTFVRGLKPRVLLPVLFSAAVMSTTSGKS